MKYIIPLLLIFASCSSKTTTIKAQMKIYQDSLNNASLEQQKLDAGESDRLITYMNKRLPMDESLKDLQKIRAINDFNMKLNKEYEAQEDSIKRVQRPIIADLEAKQFQYELRIKELKLEMESQ